MTARLDAMMRDGDGELTMLSPGVGWFTADALLGRVVEAGDVVGWLETLSMRRAVVAPAGVSGRVAALPSSERRRPVGYGDPLFTLASLALGAVADAAQAAGGANGQGLVSPMDGQFYRRPSPGAPEFAPEGATLQPGDTYGLIEVMKLFYPARYEGASPVRVIAWRVADGTPVGHGTPLLVIG